MNSSNKCWFSASATTDEIADSDSDNDESKDNKSETNEPNKARRFSSLENLHTRTLELLERQGIKEMTEIQEKTWDAVSTGRDVVGRSRTGSGKTLAFLLPPLERVVRELEENKSTVNKDGVRILIISPTRELASQIDSTAANLTRAHKRLSHQVLYGGVPKGKDLQQLDRRLPTVLTATPGRLLDHLQSSFLRDRRIDFSEALRNIDVLVLDEMDRLLDMGFSRDIRQIMQFLPHKDDRQTLLFSATVPPSVKKEIKFCTQGNSLSVDCIQDEDPASHTVNTVQQSYVAVPQSKQITGVLQTILQLMKPSEEPGSHAPKIVVFFNTTAQVSFFASLLKELGMPRVLELHSKIEQDQRSKRSDKFRNAPSDHPSILLTSDVSARGVDYPNVTHVVQVGSASDRETYIHRLGRTGRAGKSGKGILLLVHPDERAVFRSELKGMQIPEDKELKELLASDTDGEVYNGTPEALELLQKLPQVLQRDTMRKKSQDCYRSLLGFYVQRFKALKMRSSGDIVVDMINEFADQALLPERPGLSFRAVQQFGLERHPGITVSRKSDNDRGGRGGGSGGMGRGGMGRGRSGGNNSGYGEDRGRSSGNNSGYGEDRFQNKGQPQDRYDSDGSIGGRGRSNNRNNDRRGGGRSRY